MNSSKLSGFEKYPGGNEQRSFGFGTRRCHSDVPGVGLEDSLCPVCANMIYWLSRATPLPRTQGLGSLIG
jgi:hypothetical protein